LSRAYYWDEVESEIGVVFGVASLVGWLMLLGLSGIVLLADQLVGRGVPR